MSVMYLRAMPRWILFVMGVLVIVDWLSAERPGSGAAPDTPEPTEGEGDEDAD